MTLLAYSRYLLAVYALAGWLLPATLHAEQADVPGTILYDFGLHLYRHGDYYRAVTELKRFSLFFPDHQRHAAAQILIGLALQGDGLFDDAFVHFQHVQQAAGESDVGRVAAFKLGELRFQQEQYHQAVDHFQQFLRLFPEGPLVSHTTYLLSLAAAFNGQSDTAQRLLTSLAAHDPLSPQALALSQALQTTPTRPLKSPRTAGLLAGILPGAGHLYLGKPGQAISAFVLNGLFLTGAALAFHERLEVVGAILLYFETGWYLGNIRSATDGARDMNRQQQQTWNARLRTAYALPVITLEHLQTPSLGIRIAF
jgi:TolA-binding protein/TM2 domain-containing membrane protein YozV